MHHLPPVIPPSEEITGIETSCLRKTLNSQPVWKMLMKLPIAEAMLNSKEET